jgi:branched-subunit amino acid transport protein
MSTGYGPLAVWAAFVAIGALTYGFRLSFLYAFGEDRTIGERGQQVLRLVPPAVLAALAIPAILTLRPSVSATVVDERVLAGAVATAVAWRTEEILPTILAGMVTLWVLRFGVF